MTYGMGCMKSSCEMLTGADSVWHTQSEATFPDWPLRQFYERTRTSLFVQGLSQCEVLSICANTVLGISHRVIATISRAVAD
jgi:hypothetical protein